MNLFDQFESEKDQSVIEPIGIQPTQPMALAFSIDEREMLKKAMKAFYGDKVKDSNYSDFFLELIKLYVDGQDN